MSARRVNRGNNSARNWNQNTATNTNSNNVWRPALNKFLIGTSTDFSTCPCVSKGALILRLGVNT